MNCPYQIEIPEHKYKTPMEFRFACLSLFYKYIAPLEQLLSKIP